MPVAEATALLADRDIIRLLEPWSREDRVALAVSGGVDSVAMMLMAARWRALSACTPSLLVLTVDHGLRPQAILEAQKVAEWACGLGLKHQILSWRGSKPVANIQAIAREVRYRLMIDACHRLNASCLFTAHHLQDQAETVMLRLARGSGVDGLAAMLVETPMMGVRICRPFLNVPRARLRSTVSAAGHSFIDDPSNEDSSFARVRIRALMGRLSAEGFSAARLADTARRMRRAKIALDEAVDALSVRAAHLDPMGFCVLRRAALSAVSGELTLRLLVRALMAVGGRIVRPRARLSERLVQAVEDGVVGRRTLHGCRIDLREHDILIWRESGRCGLPVLKLHPGDRALWDGRFQVSLDCQAPGDVEVRPLGEAGWALIRRMMPVDDTPAVIGRVCPSVWRCDRLLAVPSLLCLEEGIKVSFVGALTGPPSGAFSDAPGRLTNLDDDVLSGEVKF